MFLKANVFNVKAEEGWKFYKSLLITKVTPGIFLFQVL